jgi:hypothetical protein
VTEKEKYIYNCYLEISRKLNNQPFRYRKNFDSFEEKEEYTYIVKLSQFFSKFPHINIKDFFEAPFFVYNDKFVEVKFYTTQRAIKAYTIYQNNFLNDNPDHLQTLEKIKNSFIFIKKFCSEKNITIFNYICFKEQDKQWHSFMIHLKDRNINIYSLYVFPKFDTILQQYDSELKSFTFGNTFNNLNFYRTKYLSSKNAKKLCILMFNKLTSNNNKV